MATATLIPVRETIRCRTCKLNQFKRLDNTCPRCKSSYLEPPGSVGEAPVPVTVPSTPHTSGQAQAGASIAANVKLCREARGLSQRELGDKMGVVRTYISKVERSHAIPIVTSLERFADALGVTVGVLIGSQPTDTIEHDPFMAMMISSAPMLSQEHREDILEFVRHIVRRRRLAE